MRAGPRHASTPALGALRRAVLVATGAGTAATLALAAVDAGTPEPGRSPARAVATAPGATATAATTPARHAQVRDDGAGANRSAAPSPGRTAPGAVTTSTAGHGAARPTSSPSDRAPASAPAAAAPAPRAPRPSPRPSTRPPRPPTAEPSQSDAPPSVMDGEEAEVLALVNAERATVGCPEVTADPTLAAVARAHSRDMAGAGYFDHTSPDGRSPFDRIRDGGYRFTRAAENIAAGQRSPAAVMAAWMDSPGHRENILDCTLLELGVGRAQDDGSPYGVYWTQDFGTRG